MPHICALRTQEAEAEDWWSPALKPSQGTQGEFNSIEIVFKVVVAHTLVDNHTSTNTWAALAGADSTKHIMGVEGDGLAGCWMRRCEDDQTHCLRA